MLTPKQLQNLPKPLTDIYSELSDFVLQDIALRISKAAKITDTAEYQMYRARALGMSTDAIKKEIARINGAAESEIAELIREAAERSDEFDRKMLGVSGGMTLSENTQLQKLMAAQIEQTRGLCSNLTGTLGFAQRTADGRMVYGSATDFLRKQMDMAQMKVMTGVCDYNTAVRQACFALADSGLRTIYYASGRSDRIEVAVRRALMTSVSQLTQKISEQNAAEFGADGWEISAHIGARPSHAVYQGRQYPNSQYETIVLPLITDYNCRHSAYPIIMGVTKPAYSDEELTALDPPPFTYEGRQYTAYEAQQQMRKMERSMRRQKDRCVVADAVGDNDVFTAASIKLRRQKDYYEDFCKAAGTYTEYERTFVSGYNRQLAAKTGAVTRKQNAFKNAQITLTNSGNGGIIKEQNGKPITKITDKAIDRVPKVDISGYTDEQCKYIQQQHRELLKYARDKNNCNEVAFVFRKDFSDRSEFLGTDDSLSLGTALMGKGNDIFVMHNHPRNSSFSDTDIAFLLGTDNVKTLSVIKNNGLLEVLTKTQHFNKNELILDFKRQYKKFVKTGSDSEIDKAVKKFIERNREGLEWSIKP